MGPLFSGALLVLGSVVNAYYLNQGRSVLGILKIRKSNTVAVKCHKERIKTLESKEHALKILLPPVAQTIYTLTYYQKKKHLFLETPPPQKKTHVIPQKFPAGKIIWWFPKNGDTQQPWVFLIKNDHFGV